MLSHLRMLLLAAFLCLALGLLDHESTAARVSSGTQAPSATTTSAAATGIVTDISVGAYNAGAAGTTVEMAVDCDTSTIGVQNACTIDTASVAAIPIDVILTNNTGATTTVAALNYDLYNDQCFSTIASPASGSCKNGNTANPAGGIGPSVPVLDPANFPANYICSSPPASADAGTGVSGTSTSFLSCFLASGVARAVANGASARISGESFSDNVTAGTTIVLTLSNVAVFDDNFIVSTVSCDAAAPPPASPEGNVSGPCFPAILCFIPGGIGPCAFPPTAGPADSDGDGVCDPGKTSTLCTGSDACANTPVGATPDADGCSAAQLALLRMTLVNTFKPILILGEGNLCPADPTYPNERLLSYNTKDPYEPTRVETFLAPNNTRLLQQNLRGADTDLLSPTGKPKNGRPPTAQDLYDHPGSSVYIDIQGISPGTSVATCQAYAAAYSHAVNRLPTVYAHIEDLIASQGVVRVVYHFFYFYDDFIGNNQHEGDWEQVAVVFRPMATCSFESLDWLAARGCTPDTAEYSRHGFIQVRPWIGASVDKDGLRSISYVGRGSHTNYFKPTELAATVAQDLVPYDPLGTFVPADNRGRRFTDYVIAMPPCDNVRESAYAWTHFAGHWGQIFNQLNVLVRFQRWGPVVDVCA